MIKNIHTCLTQQSREKEDALKEYNFSIKFIELVLFNMNFIKKNKKDIFFIISINNQ